MVFGCFLIVLRLVWYVVCESGMRDFDCLQVVWYVVCESGMRDFDCLKGQLLFDCWGLVGLRKARFDCLHGLLVDGVGAA